MPPDRQISKACDACRGRKIKCDKASPRCSYCRMSQRECIYSRPKKRGPKSSMNEISQTPSVRSHSPQNNRCATSDEEQYQQSNSEQRPETSLDQHSESSVQHYAEPTRQPYLDSVPERFPNIPTYEFSTISADVSGLNTTIQGDRPPSQTARSYGAYQITDNSLRPQYSSSAIVTDLRSSAMDQCGTIPLEDIVSECINAFINHLFPLMPLVHEPTIRSLLSDFQSSTMEHTHTSPHSVSTPVSLLDPSHVPNNLHQMRNLALLTAVSAVSGCMLPSSLCPRGVLLAPYLLLASRRALTSILDSDLQSPCAASITMRYFHGNCTHALGQTRVSWILMGEALRIAQSMRLYDESSYTTLDPTEAKLRRHIFWQLYTGDKSSALLNNNPFSMHELTLGEPLTVEHPSADGIWLLSSQRQLESVLIIGFNLCQRLFYYTAELMLEMRYATRYSVPGDAVSNLSAAQISKMVDLYIKCTTALDDAPGCLRSFSTIQDPELHEEGRGNRLNMLRTQVANLLVTNHCLKLLITQRCAEYGLQTVLGLPKDTTVLDLRRSEIARELVKTIQEAPFDALRGNGEPSNEKIRQVGVTLLEISHKTKNTSLAARTKADLAALLDILSRLDSKASEALARADVSPYGTQNDEY